MEGIGAKGVNNTKKGNCTNVQSEVMYLVERISWYITERFKKLTSHQYGTLIGNLCAQLTLSSGFYIITFALYNLFMYFCIIKKQNYDII